VRWVRTALVVDVVAPNGFVDLEKEAFPWVTEVEVDLVAVAGDHLAAGGVKNLRADCRQG